MNSLGPLRHYGLSGQRCAHMVRAAISSALPLCVLTILRLGVFTSGHIRTLWHRMKVGTWLWLLTEDRRSHHVAAHVTGETAAVTTDQQHVFMHSLLGVADWACA